MFCNYLALESLQRTQKKFGPSIDLIHKWRPINNSFIFMLISPPSLISMCKIQNNFYSKMRLGWLISINMKEKNNPPPFMNKVYGINEPHDLCITGTMLNQVTTVANITAMIIFTLTSPKPPCYSVAMQALLHYLSLIFNFILLQIKEGMKELDTLGFKVLSQSRVGDGHPSSSCPNSLHGVERGGRRGIWVRARGESAKLDRPHPTDRTLSSRFTLAPEFPSSLPFLCLPRRLLSKGWITLSTG